LDTFEIEDGEAAGATELRAHLHVGNAVHGGGDERQPEAKAADVEGEFAEVGVDGVLAAGDDGDIVEAVGAPHLLELRLGHRSYLLCAAGPARL
jgi:hypothetical protein